MSDSRSSVAILEKRLRPIIEEPSFEQIIAIERSRVIGSAVLSLRRGDGDRSVKGWLEDFVVHPDARGQGVADKMADFWEKWYDQNDAKILNFTSGYERKDAHRFYHKRGAYIIGELTNPETSKETAYFEYPIRKV